MKQLCCPTISMRGKRAGHGGRRERGNPGGGVLSVTFLRAQTYETHSHDGSSNTVIAGHDELRGIPVMDLAGIAPVSPRPLDA